MKQFVALAVLAVGLSACQGQTSVGAGTPSRPALADLTEWQPEPYIATNPLPAGYEGLDVELLRDFYFINNDVRLKKRASESMRGYIERVSSADALSPLVYGELYAIPIDMQLFYGRDQQGYVLRNDTFCGSYEDPLVARCFLDTTENHRYEPSMSGRGPSTLDRIDRTTFGVAILSEHLQGEPFRRLGEELLTWELELPVEAPEEQVIEAADIGTLLIGAFTSALGFQVNREHTYPSLGWDLLTTNLDDVDPDVPILVRTLAVPFSPTELVVYVKSTGEILTSHQMD